MFRPSAPNPKTEPGPRSCGLASAIIVAASLLWAPADVAAQVTEYIVIPTGKGIALGPTARVARALVQEFNRRAGENKASLYYPTPGYPPVRRGLEKKANKQLAKAFRAFSVMEYEKARAYAKKALKLQKALMKSGKPSTGYISCSHMLAAIAQSAGQDKVAYKRMNDAILVDKRPPDAKRFNDEVQRLHQQVLSETPAKGRIKLESNPPALIWFNGKLRGLAYGTARKRAGLYLVRVYTPEHILRQRWFRIKPNRVRELVTTLNKDESSEPAILGELRRDTRADTPGRAIQQVALERAAAQIIIVTANSRGCTMKRCEVGLHWTRDDLWHRRKRVVYTGDARAVALAFLKKKKPKGHGGITAIAPVGPRTCITDRQCRFKEKCVAGHCKKTASVTRKWWFWTIIGAVVVGTTVAIAVPLSSPDNPVIEVK